MASGAFLKIILKIRFFKINYKVKKKNRDEQNKIILLLVDWEGRVRRANPSSRDEDGDTEKSLGDRVSLRDTRKHRSKCEKLVN